MKKIWILGWHNNGMLLLKRNNNNKLINEWIIIINKNWHVRDESIRFAHTLVISFRLHSTKKIILCVELVDLWSLTTWHKGSVVWELGFDMVSNMLGTFLSNILKGFESEKSFSSKSLGCENPLFWMANHQWIHGHFFGV